MKAAQYRAPGEIDIVEVGDLEPAPGMLLLRTERVAICGSDLHYLADSRPESYPWEPGQSGHECVGVVETSSGSDLPEGARVLALPRNFNAFAEYMAVCPSRALQLPDGVDAEQGALAQQLGTVIFCCQKLQNVLNKDFVVIGQGPAGLLFTMLLLSMGVRRVIGLDIVDHRLVAALQLGAHHTIHAHREDPVEVVRSLTRGRMADGVVEAVGKAETICLCPHLVRQGGEVALFGVPKKDVLPIAVEDFLRKNLRLVASADAQGEPGLKSFRLALDFLARKRLDVRPLVSHRLPFTSIAEGFRLAETKEDGAIKVMLEF